ncbi:hypothetical protein [Bradyrhizobium sp.]|jgi:hypothetical protein|uniref:hypothetical protein n=1 Tax=Bradyrhizobium sp. TaxID=376 RepID=UPI002E006E50|nr:hypothetical protein [Bradyrhizobium sp.]
MVTLYVGAVIVALVVLNAGQAQMLPPGASQFSPPPPPPLPPPKIEVPVVPQMDAPPSQPTVLPPGRGSFGDRINSCLDEGAAAGLGPDERTAYSRSCANQ